MSQRVGIGLAVAVAACAAGVGLWVLTHQRPHPGPEGTERTEAEAQEIATSNWDRWSTAPKLEIGKLSETDLSGIFEIALSSTGETTLPPESIASLSTRLAQETRIRAGTDADAYIGWAESRPGERWITPNDSREWSRETTVMEDLFQEKLTESGFHDSIRRLIGQARMKEDGAVFTGISDPNRCASGCFRVRTYRVRSKEQFLMYSAQSYASQEEADEWLLSPSTSISRLRVADRSMDDVCRNSGSALVVDVAVVIDLMDDRSGIWESTWYWDSQSGSWQLDNMSWRSGDVVGLWY